MGSSAGFYLGSSSDVSTTGYLETAFISSGLSALVQDCSGFPQDFIDQYSSVVKESIGSRLGFSLEDDSFRTEKEYLQCLGSPVVELSEAKINRRLFCSYKEVCAAKNLGHKKPQKACI